jgi:hypothetical protein
MLNKNLIPRRFFDPSSPTDQEEVRYLLEVGKWKTSCPFWEENGWNTISAMCVHKLALHFLQQGQQT